MIYRNANERAIRKSLLSLLAILLPLSAASGSKACATASPPDARIEIAQEYAVIVWDAVTHTEHFIRNATFHADARDFGFLVPTPSIPTLAIEDDSLFAHLDTLLLPRHEKRTKTVYDFTPVWIGRKAMTGAANVTARRAANMGLTPASAGGVMSHSAVRVLASQQLGTYDTVVLEADNALALNHWLAQHGYASRPALTTWLQPYIASHWKITAFKIAPSPNVSEEAYRWGVIDMPPIRMSFQTNRPFYPYREPANEQDAPTRRGHFAPTAKLSAAPYSLPAGEENVDLTDVALTRPRSAPASRLLRVYMLSSERMQGTFEGQALSWPGRVTWTDRVSAQERDRLTLAINAPHDAEGERIPAASGVRLPAATRLTVFEDRSSPRPGTADVFFAKSNDQQAITPPPIIDYDIQVVAIPADLVALSLMGVIGAGFAGWRLRASRRFRPAS